jgi:(1->4)-alpha-D-glucan 1-alpha-D-glucosylmutase
VLWIEKILFSHEHLSSDWLTDGTTGYDFMNDAGALLHDPAGEEPLTSYWTATTGRPGIFQTEAEAARRQILRESLASELFNTAAALHRVARRNLSTRDYTLTGIRAVLTELLVHFHTYRIYAGPAGMSDADQRAMDWAMAGARRTVRQADRELLELVAAWVTGDGLRGSKAGTLRQEWQRAMVRFQQLSAPTAAKSVEDTAFYRYGRLISRNEVGSEPSQFAMSKAAMHGANKDRLKRFPRALLATATHDHKRGEDARMRLAVVSGLVEEWGTATQRWMRLNASVRRDLDGPAPDAADELMLYQCLVATWPLGLEPTDAPGLQAFGDRVAAWLQKALREAKRRSSWVAPDEAYEAAAHAVLANSLDPTRPVAGDIAAFVERIAAPGCINALSQAVLRMTSPGIPDLYQGTEFWDFSLVDPDNRRPVDFDTRMRVLDAAEPPDSLLAHWRDGHVKLAVTARILGFRARAPELFAKGDYIPLRIDGARAEHIFAFARVHNGRAAVVVVMRCPAGLALVDGQPVVQVADWQGTVVHVPRILTNRHATSVLDADWNGALTPRIQVAELLARFPVAVLEVR